MSRMQTKMNTKQVAKTVTRSVSEGACHRNFSPNEKQLEGKQHLIMTGLSPLNLYVDASVSINDSL